MSNAPSRPRAKRPIHFDERGAALIEFALIAPLFLAILMGTVAYGGYFWKAHTLQQIANDAARASLAGLTAAERGSIARAVVTDGVAKQLNAPPARATIAITETADAISVALAYDASREVFFRIGLLPMPNPTIRRRAAVRLGGL